ncbi:hypothetical protein PM082_011461 [Marasmius tenuissimus]|nr:hypothetical protein PM082_011461 [Marasmius tenuissimus]
MKVPPRSLRNWRSKMKMKAPYSRQYGHKTSTGVHSATGRSSKGSVKDVGMITRATTTPFVELDPVRFRPDTVAYGYEERLEEYKALLERGATRLMCRTFGFSCSP